MPAVLGMDHSTEAVTHLSDLLGVEVFEIATAPPSVPGIRLHRALVRGLVRSGVRVSTGMQVVGSEPAAADRGRAQRGCGTSGAPCRRILRHRHRWHPRRWSDHRRGRLGDRGGGRSAGEVPRRQVGLVPARGPRLRRSSHLPRRDRDGRGMAAARSGKVVWENVTVAGSLLAEAEPIREHSLDGVAVATGFLAGRAAAASLVPG